MPSLKALSAFQRDSNSSEVFYDLIEGISPLGWKWKEGNGMVDQKSLLGIYTHSRKDMCCTKN